MVKRTRVVLAAAGLALLAGALCLPVQWVAERAIPSELLEEVVREGRPERVAEIKSHFGQSLVFLRWAAGLLGAWLIAVGAMQRRLVAWSRLAPAACREAGAMPRLGRREWLWPAGWTLLVLAACFPLLFKGYEHSEIVNLEMLARRGPLVTLACQNLPPRVAQQGFTVVESLFVGFLGDAEGVARLPAWLAGALAMFPLYFIARRFGSVCLANVACLSLAATGFYLYYVPYARGYAFALTAYLACVLWALKIRERSSWPDWIGFAALLVAAAYSHMASGIFAAFLFLFMLAEHVGFCLRRGAGPAAAAASLVRPVVAVGTAFFVLLTLESVAIPAELNYVRRFSATDYYFALHVDARFLRVMADAWSWLRGAPAVAWVQAGAFAVGVVVLLSRSPWPAAYLFGPLAVSLALVWWRGMFLFPRYIFHFLPFYALGAVYMPARVASGRAGWRRAWRAALVLGLLVCWVFSVQRLVRMERCGVRTAVEDARAVMEPGDRLAGVLDGFLTVRHYYPEAVSMYTADDFRRVLQEVSPPEFVISVPYLDMDIPGGTVMLERRYELHRSYPSWLDVDDNKDTVYLYRRRNDKAAGGFWSTGYRRRVPGAETRPEELKVES